ncbi:sensor histidine kinase [Fictibacillus sp. KIGAM418]|uniref:histidine kinase n=1 Tax=Fictibacillus marinisediminis TaxID=2878389 RepID=A0A9X2BE51_9BACL|nr:sensor histidine kinase [Fictibacillus marinisediminis]MCK6257335.1 sensor histidine kinase [Fictibacillus marinisediminis]
MKKIYKLFQINTGISPYVWSVFSILPFYFIFQSSSTKQIVVGILLTILFFITYRFAFISKGWPVYVWASILIAISITMTSLFNYVYFAFFLAYFIGNIKERIPFISLYIIHLVSTTVSFNFNIVFQDEQFLKQLPFIIIIWISIILMPFSLYNRKKREQLEEQLQDANSVLVKQQERQRIARDLHDTLGQKLSLIGLKSDLARKLIDKDPEQARSQLNDVQQTARTALNEVRKMVSQMRGIRLEEELINVKQILKAAQIEYVGEQELNLTNVSLLIENILSMCLKEAVTNVVKHSGATTCHISIKQSLNEIMISIRDNGAGIRVDEDMTKGHGLLGIKERLEFVNGHLEIFSEEGTTLIIQVPNVIKSPEKEGDK